MSLNFSLEKLVVLLSLVPVLLVSLMLHELAHGLVAYKLGDPTAKRMGRLSLNPLKHLDPVGTAMFFITYLLGFMVFGWAKPVPVSPYYFKNRQRGMALVGMAGPVTNFIVAVAAVLILNAVKVDANGIVFKVLFMVFQVNVVLGIFNLIPVPPLDGSRVVGAFLPRTAYEKWVALDQYGMFLAIIVLIIVVRLGVLAWAVQGLADVFLTNYHIVWA
jgi:Zn-dependent protease